MTPRRRLNKLKATLTVHFNPPQRRVWVVLPARDDEPLDRPVVRGSVVIVPRDWTPRQIDAFLTTQLNHPIDKLILGADPLTLV